MRISITFLALALAQLSFAQTTIKFSVNDIPDKGYKNVGLRGSLPPLSWDKSMAMTQRGDQYFINVDFEGGTEILEFKFVLYNSDKAPEWEGTENRKETLKPGQTITSNHSWETEQFIDPAALPKLTVDQLMADYEIIKTAVLEVHPGTFRYNDENSINQGLATLKEKFSSPLTIGEAYLAISALLGQIKCDHTFASYYNQNAAVKSVIHRQRDKLPFTFRWIDGKMIVKEDGTDNNKLGKATEVLTINEIPVAQIQKALLPYIPADGTATKTRIAYSQIRGYSFRYDAFDIFHPLLFPFKSEDISLTIKKYSATATSKLTVKATTRVERNKKIRSKYPDFPGVRDDLWKFEILEGNVGLLTIGSFVLNGWKSLELDYKKFLADAFAELKEKKVESLIIDLRENMGGNDEMAGELATYFNISSFVEDQYEGRSRYKVLPEAIKPHVKTWGPDPWYFELNPDKKDEQSGYYIYEKEFFQKYKNKTKKTVFKGDIYLLTSSINVSLAYYLSEKVKRYKIATLIGQTTGGNLRGINGGSILFLTLPNSKIEIDLPIIGSFSIKSQPDIGITPDVQVEQSLENLYDDVDTELVTALELIQKGE